MNGKDLRINSCLSISVIVRFLQLCIDQVAVEILYIFVYFLVYTAFHSSCVGSIDRTKKLHIFFFLTHFKDASFSFLFLYDDDLSIVKMSSFFNTF